MRRSSSFPTIHIIAGRDDIFPIDILCYQLNYRGMGTGHWGHTLFDKEVVTTICLKLYTSTLILISIIYFSVILYCKNMVRS